ncbi:hypothetical protein QBC40DRAFT_275200 [Triangularia verruculosa]|uniref:Uncharacterized protein n=1 Tax=Triangularia verruculosa TaxID=2587418 RepID=A0AAN7AY31_9PEZI|nr:hypothetical protein QBC40DRAFT_275200 [Triangularia verruculosa]
MNQQEKVPFLVSSSKGEPQHPDSTQAQHQQRRTTLRRTVRILGAVICLLVFLLHILPQVPLGATSQHHHHHASKTSEPFLSPRSLKHVIEKRIPGEHVVLADCRDRKNVVSSQMAYYVGDPGPIPGDVAVVETPPGQTALWVNTETSALFYNSNVTFKAVLGPKTGEGLFAGTGDNGYGNFTCWQRYKNNLYNYNNDTLCSQVYACNHDAVPAVLPSATPNEGPSGLSQGAMIAIIVAVVGSVLFGIAMGVFWWYWRRTRQRQQATHAAEDGEPKATESEPSPPPPTYASAVQPRAPSIAPRFELAPGTLYEMDGQWYRVEMAADNSRYEMDAQSIKKSAAVASEEVGDESPTTSAGTSSLSGHIWAPTTEGMSATGTGVATTATITSDSRGNLPILTPVNAEGRVVSPPVAGMPVPVLVPIPTPSSEGEGDHEAEGKTGLK